MPTIATPAARPSGVLIAQVVFALLVVATIAAFFVTTRLKRSAPVVEHLEFPRYLSPNGDGRKDTVQIGFRTKRTDEATVSIISSAGDDVRTLVQDLQLDAGTHRLRWDGRLGTGRVAPDGEYRVRVGLRHQARSVISPRKLFVDTKPPRPVVRYVSPATISPDGIGTRNRAKLRFDGPIRGRPRLLVYRTDLPRPALVARRLGRAGSDRLSWDGKVGTRSHSRPAPSGNYVLAVRTTDAAGNVGPPGLPPRRGSLPGHPGLAVRYVAARGPDFPVFAGARARFGVESDGRRYHWTLRRLGSRHVLRRGSSGATVLGVHVPRMRSGVALLSIRAGRHRYETPLAVQGRRRGRVLVVLPATTWEARNELDADGDGFGDQLPLDATVSRRRAFAGTGLPPGFTAREAPLLAFLDRARLRYDITTDLALARGGTRAAKRYRGVLFAAAPRFFSSQLGELSRSYLDHGGRMAWLGTGGFTAPVQVTQTTIAGGKPSAGANYFGEHLRDVHARGALAFLSDRIEFFRGIGTAFGPFASLEQSARLPAGARLLASAGHEANRPSLVVYRQRSGVVVRVGVDGFARAARGSGDVTRIMRRLWTLLSR